MGISEVITTDNASKAIDAYAVEITCKGLVPKAVDNSICLYDEKGVEVFRIEAPYMMDADGEICKEVVLQLVPCVSSEDSVESGADELTLKTQPDSESARNTDPNGTETPPSSTDASSAEGGSLLSDAEATDAATDSGSTDSNMGSGSSSTDGTIALPAAEVAQGSDPTVELASESTGETEGGTDTRDAINETDGLSSSDGTIARYAKPFIC